MNKTNGKKANKKIPAAVICTVLAVLVVAGAFSLRLVNERLDKGDYLREATVYESDNFKVDAAMLTYYFYDEYQSFLSDSSFDSSAIDSSKPLKKQNYNKSTTWFEYFRDKALSDARANILFAEAATREGYDLSDDEIADIEESAKKIKISEVGRGITTADITEAKKLETLGKKYYSAVGKASFTDDEYNTVLKDNLKLIGECSYYKFDIKYSGKDERNSAKETADSLAAATSGEEFASAVSAYLAEKSQLDETEISEEIGKMAHNVCMYTDCDKEFGDWMFADSRVDGDTRVSEDKKDKKFSVYYTLSAPINSNSDILNIRNIMIKTSPTDSMEESVKTIMNIQNEYISSAQTEDAFIKIADKYNQDKKADDGGLYEDYQNGTIKGDRFNEWCFDSARKVGDYAVLQSDDGLNLTYISTKSKRWKHAAETILLDGWRSDYCNTLEENINVKYNEKSVEKMPIK